MDIFKSFDKTKPASADNPKEGGSNRNQHSKLFDIGENKKIVVVKQSPMHYKDKNGKWEDIDLTIVNGKIEKAPYQANIFKDKIGYEITDAKGKYSSIELTHTGTAKAPLAYKKPTFTKNEVIWEDILPNVDIKIVFDTNKVLFFRTLKTHQAERDYTWKVIREKTITDKVLFTGWDNNEKFVDNIVQELSARDVRVNGVDCEEKVINDKFNGRIQVIDPKTRKRSWSEDVQYPVVIDPTINTTIQDNANDGVARISAGSISVYTSYVKNFSLFCRVLRYTFGTLGGSRYDCWIRFPSVIIPSGATITNAYLVFYAWVKQVPPRPPVQPVFKLKAINQSNPNQPASANQIINPVAVLATQPTWTPVPHAKLPGGLTPVEFYAQQVDLTSMVTALVSSYDYSSGKAMMFTIGEVTNQPHPSPAYVYQRNWGTAKAPSLVIEYSTASAGHISKISGLAWSNVKRVDLVNASNIKKINGVPL